MPDIAQCVPDRIELNGGCKSLIVIMRDAWENKRKCNLIIIAEDSKAGTFVNVIVGVEL